MNNNVNKLSEAAHKNDNYNLGECKLLSEILYINLFCLKNDLFKLDSERKVI